MKIFINLLVIGCLFLCGYVYAGTGSAKPAHKPARHRPVSKKSDKSHSDKAAIGVPYIRINHPVENAHLPELASTFVYGQAPSSGALTINGQPVPIEPGGGFLAMVDLSSGTFKINAELTMGTSVCALTRTILVDGPVLPSPVSPLTLEYVNPSGDYLVMPGDEITVSAKGSPGMRAFFTVSGSKKEFPLVEAGGGQGIYNGVYVAGAQDKLKDANIEATLVNTKTNTKINKKADGLISFLPDTTPLIAETTTYANLHVGPAPAKGNAAGYYMPLPKGTLLRVTGSKGDELRVRLTKTKEAWINRGMVKALPAGTLPGHDIVGNIVIAGHERSTNISISLGRKIPFEVQGDIDGRYIDVILYGAYSNTDFMNYVSTGIVEQVKWFQDDAETYRLRAYTPNTKWWGYDARYEGGNLILEVRSPPPAVAGSKLPLAGLTIAVDAGHSPDTGAVGVTGLLERDANLNIAKMLKKKLAGLGANVAMTREGSEPVELYSRSALAWQSHADIFISVHNNAFGDGQNPLKKNGYGVYYFHPVSFALAAEIHKAYGELVGMNSSSKYKLRDDGLYYGNFVITRTFQMPAVLTESAYMIVPREEAFLKTEKFQSACAEAIARGIVRYMNHARPAAIKKNNPSAKKKK